MAKRRGPSYKRRERRYEDGAVLLWPIHLALLQGLFDRPGGSTSSRYDFIVAAAPHCVRLYGRDGKSYWTRCEAIQAILGWGLIDRKRIGRKNHFSLTGMGRAIVEGEVPVRLWGRTDWVPRCRRAWSWRRWRC